MVEGEGEADPREAPQAYDGRGRPVNTETKRIHRDMIRSHNEVMQVIGGAEPENTNIFAEAEMQREHHEYEQRMGYHLLDIARVIQIGGVSVGINGFRQRILVGDCPLSLSNHFQH